MTKDQKQKMALMKWLLDADRFKELLRGTKLEQALSEEKDELILRIIRSTTDSKTQK